MHTNRSNQRQRKTVVRHELPDKQILKFLSRENSVRREHQILIWCIQLEVSTLEDRKVRSLRKPSSLLHYEVSADRD